VLRKLLHLRAELPRVFLEGNYAPLAANGPRAGNLIAFSRRAGTNQVVVIAAIRSAEGVEQGGGLSPPPEWWGDTRIEIPASAASEPARLFTGEALTNEGSFRISDCLGPLPAELILSRR
jgi:(1->4)-alpha-D-glucan 1-alpha-D-glucosylmutase